MYNMQISGLDEARAKFGENVVSAAIRSTVNKLSSRAATEVNKAVRETYAIKAGDLKKRGTHNRNGIEVRKAKRGEDFAMILGYGGPLPLINFQVTPRTPERDKARKRRKGVRVMVKRGGGKNQLRHVFVQRMSNGHVGLFERVKEDSRYDGRFPIKELTGPSVPAMLKSKINVVEQVVSQNTSTIFDHELQFYVEKAGGKL